MNDSLAVSGTTALVDYGAGNLTSVRNAFAALGVETTATRDPAVVAAADRVVFPGVGAAKSAMANLREMGLEGAVRAAAAEKPFLGICLGMQILFGHSEEDGGVDLLGVLPGAVRRFPEAAGEKIPEIGWNQVRPRGGARLGAAEGAEFYFVHSYYAEVGPYTAGVTDYAGVTFTSMVRRGRLWACQFHPEKSGRAGLALIKEWLAC